MNLWDKAKKIISGKTKTEAQTPDTKEKNPGFGGIVAQQDALTDPSPKTLKTYRLMRRDPTIALARAVANAPIRQAEFTTERDKGVPEARETFIADQMNMHWRRLVQDMLYARDYGFQAFEKTFELTDDGMMGIGKLKPLIPEWTTVVLQKRHGLYEGLRNGPREESGLVSSDALARATFVRAPYTFWYTHNQEGANWYGEPDMERARKAYDDYREANARYNQYVMKNAAPIPMVEYPQGESEDENGETTENYLIAHAILNGLSKCKGVAMPNVLAAYAEDLMQAGADPNKLEAWRIQFIDTKGSHGAEFDARLKQLDQIKMRAWLVPERTATEGQHGTKAEAESHGDIVLTVASNILDCFVDAINHWIVNQLLVLNFGPGAENTVRVRVAKLDPDIAVLMRDLVKAQFGAPVNADLFMDFLDSGQMFEMLGLPAVPDMAEKINEREQDKPEEQDMEGDVQKNTMGSRQTGAK